MKKTFTIGSCFSGIFGVTLPDIVERMASSVTDGETSRLSPLFTEEMMGFPFLWTALPFLSPDGRTKASEPTETP